MTPIKTLKLPEHPLFFGSFRSWMRLLRDSGGIDPRYIPRVLFVSATTLLTTPLRIFELLCYQQTIKRVTVHPAPLFIIGHWRSGTTHLHNLLCQDQNLGFITTFQATAPGFCLTGEKILKPTLGWIARKTHPTRMIDNIPLSLDAPQETDLAIANLCTYSWFHAFSFPKRASEFFEKYVFFEGIPQREISKWRQVYLSVLQKATLRTGGKRLATKNPVDSARLQILLDLFPGAKFIHIVRDPYRIYASTRFLYQTVLSKSQFQGISSAEVDAHILRSYQALMGKYLEERTLIPKSNLVEVRFEDLEANPLEQMRRIYDHLNLPGFNIAEPAMHAFLESLVDYQKNPYSLDGETIKKVNQHWEFAFKAWDYPMSTASNNPPLDFL